MITACDTTADRQMKAATSTGQAASTSTTPVSSSAGNQTDPTTAQTQSATATPTQSPNPTEQANTTTGFVSITGVLANGLDPSYTPTWAAATLVNMTVATPTTQAYKRDYFGSGCPGSSWECNGGVWL